MIPPTPRLGCCNNSLRSSWCRPAERGRAERGKNDKQHHQVFTAKLRDSWNVSERNHWMKKWGRCRENLQLWPPFLTLVPFLCMINLFVVQRSRLQYGFHMSAKNATSFSKISQRSIHCYHLAFLFHGQMFIYTSYCTWNHFFFTYFYFHIYFHIFASSSRLWPTLIFCVLKKIESSAGSITTKLRPNKNTGNWSFAQVKLWFSDLWIFFVILLPLKFVYNIVFFCCFFHQTQLKLEILTRTETNTHLAMFSCSCMCLYFSGQQHFDRAQLSHYIRWILGHYFSTDVFSSPQLFCSKKSQALSSSLGQDAWRWQRIMWNMLCMTSAFNIQVYLREREVENPDGFVSEVAPTMWQLMWCWCKKKPCP